MLNQIEFGVKLKNYRKERDLTQNEVASKIGVSDNAVSKREKGDCLPDIYNLKLLSRLFRISIDDMLDTENEETERINETIKIGEATFDVINKKEAIYAGKIIYAKDYADLQSFYSAIGSINENQKQNILSKIIDCVYPLCDINMSVNFWLNIESRAFGFVRETTNEVQPADVDVYKMPSSLYIRAYTNKETAHLLAKEQCEIWELFAYIRNYIMPAHGFKMAINGAQELEVFDTSEHKSGYAYMPVIKV